MKIKAFKARKDLYVIFTDDLDGDMLVTSTDELDCYVCQGEIWISGEVFKQKLIDQGYTLEEADKLSHPEQFYYDKDPDRTLGTQWMLNSDNWEAVEWE